MEDKPTGDAQQHGGAQGASQNPPPPLTQAKTEEIKGADPKAGTEESAAHPDPPKSRWRRFGIWLRSPDGAAWMMVILTFVIAFSGVVGIVLIIRSGGDTQKMITAAQRQAAAAQQFACTAGLINGNMNGAVQKLGEQADNARRFFEMDERAWVEFGKIDTIIYPPDPPFGTTFKYSIFLKNYGKTVATDVRVHIDNIDADVSFDDNKKAIRMSQDQLFKVNGTNKRAIEPNKPGPQTVAPQELTTVPIFSGGQEPRQWGKSYRDTFVLGRIDYLDAFGTRHWMRFCYVVGNSRGELGHCTYGNEEDGNPEKPN